MPARAASLFRPRREPLRSVAQRGGRLFGSAINTLSHADDTAYNALIGQQCDVVTSENSGKWSRTQGGEGVFDFSELNGDIAFAQTRGLSFHVHAFIWHNAQPTWLSDNLAANPNDALNAQSLITDHIAGFASEYGADPSAEWQSVDVVNEVVGDHTEGTYAETNWFTAAGDGPSYIHHAFERAKAEFGSNVIYVWNEHQITENTASGVARRANGLTAIDALLNSGIIEPAELRFGMQCHLPTSASTGTRRAYHRATASFCASMAAKGVAVWITELDLDVGNLVSPAEQYAETANMLRIIADNCDLERVATWNLADRYTFVPNNSLPFDDKLRPKRWRRALFEGLNAGA